MRQAAIEIPPQENFRRAAFRMVDPGGSGPLRGTLVVQTGFNHDGRGLVEDPEWRAFCAANRLALMAGWWECVLPGREIVHKLHLHYTNAPAGSGAAFWKAHESLAAEIGCPDLAGMPVYCWGHSAGGQLGHGMACAYPHRIAGFVSIKGGYYPVRPEDPGIAAVPGLFIAGERDANYRFRNIRRVFEDGRTRFRAPWARAVEPLSGHDVDRANELAVPFLQAILNPRTDAPGAPGASSACLTTGEIRAEDGPPDDDPARAWFPDPETAGVWARFCKGADLMEPPGAEGR